jgi:hypothetical protein
MKHFFLSLAAAFVGLGLQAQTSVPTSWDCSSGTPPTGWTFVQTGGSGATNYTASSACDGISALRLDAQNEALIIFCGQQPGAVSYQIGGSSSGAAFQGTFVVQESVDGVSYTDMATYADGDLSVTACLSASVTPTNPLSRYIRFYFSEKVSGYNVKLDEVSIAAPSLTVASIEVKQGTTTILNGGICEPFNGSTVDFTINNLGTVDPLNVSDIQFSGINADAFSVVSPTLPFVVNPSGSTTLTLAFNPTVTGTNIADIAISSDDADDPTFSFTLYGVNGTFATEPTTEIGIVNFPVNKSYRIVAAFNGTILSEDILGGYVVLRSDNGPITTAPADGQMYQRGMNIGSAKVVYAGRPENDNVTVNSRYVTAGTMYHFAVFPYSGSGSFTNYINTINESMVTTPATMVSGTEYSSVNVTAPSFITDLKAVINPHNSIFYSNYGPVMINLFQARDTFAVVGANTFKRVINCAYSGETKLFNDPFDWSGTGYSREHSFPHSWMPSFPADNPEQPEYNDYHHLYATRQTNVNDLRCNYPFGEVVTVETQFLEGTIGLDANGHRVYEPRDAHKGRAARALMYMSTCYDSETADFSFNRPVGQQCLSVQINYAQDQNVMKKWHFQYPPDNYDVARNDFLDSLQQNRNPFVDQPDYACYIDFLTMSKIDNPSNPCYDTAQSVNDAVQLNLLAYPNPSNGSVRISWKGYGESLQLRIVDLTGRTVFTKVCAASQEVQVEDFQAGFLSQGIYQIQLIGNKAQSAIPLVVQ